jgi:thiamine-phosphate pyrophosphorylase
MEMKRVPRLKGLYLVVSPILPPKELLSATEKALNGGVDVLQLSVELEIFDVNTFARELADLARKHEKPFIMNNDLKLAKEVEADGVHFDASEITPKEARQALGKECLVGYTVNVDMQEVLWAEKDGADYVSFCSVFHGRTTAQCPVISIETVRNARSLTSLSIFAAGGINLNNAHLVLEAGADGIAVTSALLKAKDPEQTARAFKEIIRKYRRNSNEKIQTS